ncbi:MAG: DNA-protecting protein DprA, partial [Acetobacteraceae bacterium]|nr:DNA-protecting protein DprA [Acetobacteraceae bacterium]
ETAADVLQNLPILASSVGRGEQRNNGRAAGPAENAAVPPEELVGLQPQVIELLGPSPTTVDDVLRRCQLSPSAVMAVLLELELAGRVETLPGNRIALLADEAR